MWNHLRIVRRRVIRFAFDHRRQVQRVLRFVVPRPVPIRLPEFTMYVRLDDWAVGARVAVKRQYEPHVSRVMRSRIQPGMVVVDVGANIGYYSLLAARLVGSAGKVIAFEPGADNVELIQRSARANGFGQIETHRLAVADREGEVRFNMDDSNGGIHRGELGRNAVLVRSVSLDEQLRDEPRVDAIKIDIEGAEGLALRGMSAILSRCRPSLFLEFTPDALPAYSGLSGEELLDVLRGHDYEIRVIAETGATSAAPESNAEIMRRFAASGSDHLDLLATPRRLNGPAPSPSSA
jgi:FkbM family methyltransferase